MTLALLLRFISMPLPPAGEKLLFSSRLFIRALPTYRSRDKVYKTYATSKTVEYRLAKKKLGKTVWVPRAGLKLLDKRRNYPRETYGDIIIKGFKKLEELEAKR